MISRHASILALFVFAPAATPAVGDDSIAVAAQEVVASVRPRPTTSRAVDLPPLTFKLRAAIACAGEPVSVTFSIADSFATKARADLDGLRAVEASLTVPPRQLPLPSNRRFCSADDSDDELYAPGFATVHASLQCADEAGVVVRFASAPLDVRLSCDRAEPRETGLDQESSADAR